ALLPIDFLAICRLQLPLRILSGMALSLCRCWKMFQDRDHICGNYYASLLLLTFFLRSHDFGCHSRAFAPETHFQLEFSAAQVVPNQFLSLGPSLTSAVQFLQLVSAATTHWLFFFQLFQPLVSASS